MNTREEVEIEVTPVMVEVGLEAFCEHHYGEDPQLMLEHVYRAMAYASLLASSTNPSK